MGFGGVPMQVNEGGNVDKRERNERTTRRGSDGCGCRRCEMTKEKVSIRGDSRRKNLLGMAKLKCKGSERFSESEKV